MNFLVLVNPYQRLREYFSPRSLNIDDLSEDTASLFFESLRDNAELSAEKKENLLRLLMHIFMDFGLHKYALNIAKWILSARLSPENIHDWLTIAQYIGAGIINAVTVEVNFTAGWPLNFGSAISTRWAYWLDRWEHYATICPFDNFWTYADDLSFFTSKIQTQDDLFSTQKRFIHLLASKCLKSLEKAIELHIFPASASALLTVCTSKFRPFLSKSSKDHDMKDILELKSTSLQLLEVSKQALTTSYLIDQLFLQLRSTSDSNSTLNLFSDIIYSRFVQIWLEGRFNPNQLASNYRSPPDTTMQFENVTEIEAYSRPLLQSLLETTGSDWAVHFRVEGITLPEVLPSVDNVHFYNPQLDHSHSAELENESILHNPDNYLTWVRIQVKATDRTSAERIAKVMFEDHKDRFWVHSTHKPSLGTGMLCINLSNRDFTSTSGGNSAFPIISRSVSFGFHQRTDLINHLSGKEAQDKFLNISHWLRKGLETTDNADKLAFLWICFEDFAGYEIDEKVVKTIVLVGELEKVNIFYNLLYLPLVNNYDEIYGAILEGTSLAKFPEEFIPRDFLRLLSNFEPYIPRPFLQHYIKVFCENTPQNHLKRLNLLLEDSNLFLQEIRYYRNAMFHGGWVSSSRLQYLITKFEKIIVSLIIKFENRVMRGESNSISAFFIRFSTLFDEARVKLNRGLQYYDATNAIF